MSTAGLIVMFAMYFIYMHREKKKRRKIEREEEAARREEEDDIINYKERLAAEKKEREDILSKMSYPDPTTASLDEMYDFFDYIYSDDFDDKKNRVNIISAYSDLAQSIRGMENFHYDYLTKILKKYK